jgi:hypothetical protein
MEGIDPTAVLGEAKRKDRAGRSAVAERKITGFFKSLGEAATPKRARKLGAYLGRV